MYNPTVFVFCSTRSTLREWLSIAIMKSRRSPSPRLATRGNQVANSHSALLREKLKCVSD